MSDRYMSDKMYNMLRRVTQIVLPAAGTAYFGLAAIWDLPAAEQVLGTLAIITTFFGVSLELSSTNYHAATDGDIVVTTNEEGKKIFTLELAGDPENLESAESVTFKIKSQ